jgi:hypothetical protein
MEVHKSHHILTDIDVHACSLREKVKVVYLEYVRTRKLKKIKYSRSIEENGDM